MKRYYIYHIIYKYWKSSSSKKSFFWKNNIFIQWNSKKFRKGIKFIRESLFSFIKKYSFDYISIKNKSSQIDNYYTDHQNYDYSYNYNFNNNTKSTVSENKVLRLVGEFANLQNFLPIEFTNSIIVRVDKPYESYNFW